MLVGILFHAEGTVYPGLSVFNSESLSLSGAHEPFWYIDLLDVVSWLRMAILPARIARTIWARNLPSIPAQLGPFVIHDCGHVSAIPWPEDHVPLGNPKGMPAGTAGGDMVVSSLLKPRATSWVAAAKEKLASISRESARPIA